MTDYEKLKAFQKELNSNPTSISNYHNREEYMFYHKGTFNIKSPKLPLGQKCLGFEPSRKDYWWCGSLDSSKLDQWINETREYWREKGLPSLQKKTDGLPSLQVKKAVQTEGACTYIYGETKYTGILLKTKKGGYIFCSNQNVCWNLDTERKILERPELAEEYKYGKFVSQESGNITFTDELPSLQKKKECEKCILPVDLRNMNFYACDKCGKIIKDRFGTGLSVKLFEIPNTVVNLRTQEEYDEYMQMCEGVGWKLHGRWSICRKKFCSRIRPRGSFADKDYYEKEELTVITLSELKQKIEAVHTGSSIVIGHQHKPYVETGINWGVTHASRDTISLYNPRHEDVFIKETKTNKIMNNIKNVAKRLLLSEPEKTYVKAGLMTIDKEWGNDAIETGREQMLADYMSTKGFKDQMTKVANAIIKESK